MKGRDDMSDLIDREAVMEIILMPQNVSIIEQLEMLKKLPSASQWIPVTERLPEEDKEVLITYKRKGDELDKPYSNIDITTYGQMYFGGNKVGNYKHWRSPFQYFKDNYEVTAWHPLPEPYEEVSE